MEKVIEDVFCVQKAGIDETELVNAAYHYFGIQYHVNLDHGIVFVMYEDFKSFPHWLKENGYKFRTGRLTMKVTFK